MPAARFGSSWGGIAAVSSKVSGTPSSNSSLHPVGWCRVVATIAAPAAEALSRLAFRLGGQRSPPHPSRQKAGLAGLRKQLLQALRSLRGSCTTQHHRGAAGLPRIHRGSSSGNCQEVVGAGLRCGAVIPPIRHSQLGGRAAAAVISFTDRLGAVRSRRPIQEVPLAESRQARGPRAPGRQQPAPAPAPQRSIRWPCNLDHVSRR